MTGTSHVNNFPLDRATAAFLNVDYEHHEIHSGDHFFYYDSLEIASGVSQIYLITTPNTAKWSHMLFMASGSAITSFELYEGANRTGTTAQAIYNNNRNSLTASTLILHKGISGGTTDGALIAIRKSGSATAQSRTGAEAQRNSEIILKQNTKYLLKISSFTNANLVNLNLEWYEHISKD